MSGLTPLDHEHYLRQYHAKRNPALAVRLDVMKRFLYMLHRSGPVVHAQFERAVGANALPNQTEKVQFPFDPTAPIPVQMEAVLAAVAAGALAADVGQTIISAIGALSNARAVQELEARIITLEVKQI